MAAAIPELESIFYIAARDQWLRNTNAPRDWIVLHTVQGGEMPNGAENLGGYFRDPRNPDGSKRIASTHFGVDNDSTCRYAGFNMAVAGAVGANDRGWHIEQSGVAEQTAEQWADPYSTAMLFGQTAPLVAALCLRDNIPVRFVDAAGLRRGDRGITTHHECWKAFGGDVRTDPGPFYPMGDLLAAVTALLTGQRPTTPTEDSFMPATEAEWARLAGMINGARDETVREVYKAAALVSTGVNEHSTKVRDEMAALVRAIDGENDAEIAKAVAALSKAITVATA